MIFINDSLREVWNATQSSTRRDSAINLGQQVVVETSGRQVPSYIVGVVQTIAQVSIAVVFVCVRKAESMSDFMTPVGTDSEMA